MLKHFLELLRSNYRVILACAFGAGLLALTLSVLLLNAKPLYESSVAVTMEPSEEELRFNRSFMGVSQFNPATIIAQSHVERLLSRPVAERAIDMLTAELGGEIASKPPSVFTGITTGIWRVWNTLNYGYFVPLTDREQMVADMQNAISVEIVEGSYILKIGITYDDPVIAAAAANVLAQAYIGEAQEGFRQEAAEIAGTIATAEETARDRLAERRRERQALSTKLGVTDPVAERTILLQAREDARADLRITDAELASEQRRLDALAGSLATQVDVEIARGIRESLATGQAELEQLSELRHQRQQSLAEIEASLSALDEAAAQLSGPDEQIASVEADLAELQALRVASELASRARLSQVMVINPATVPLYPTSPKVAVNTIVAMIVGGLLALVPVFARDALGSRVRTSLDVEQVGEVRVLPSLTRRQIARGRPRRDDIDRLVRLIAADRGGWNDRTLVVTGFLPERQIQRLTDLLDGATASAGEALRARAMPPLPAMADWTALRDQPVVVALASGELDRGELASLHRNAVKAGMHPYYMVIL